MRNVRKVLVMLLVCAFIFTFVSNIAVFASEDIMSIVTNQANAKAEGSEVVTAVTNISGAIITIARVVCAAVAVAMLAILGMKYMSAAPSEKADIKKHAVVYIVGAVVMFACTGILGIIQQFATTLE